MVLYEFYVYYEEKPLIGHLIRVNENTKQYRVLTNPDLITHRDAKIPYDKLGTEVKLENISRWSVHIGNIKNSSGRVLAYNMQMAPKKMVIFGAGASFDFSHDSKLNKENRPPLTANLFADEYEDVLRGFAPARNLSSEILLNGGGIEDYFQKQWNRMKISTDTLLMRKLMNTQYYIYNLFRKVSMDHAFQRRNNYNAISKWAYEYAETKNQNVVFVTFNYDVLLDWALEGTCDYSYKTVDDYVDTSNKNILLFKPHGSCNWGRKFARGFSNDVEALRKKHNKLNSLAEYLYNGKFDVPTVTDALEENISIHSVPMVNPNLKTEMEPEEWIFPHILLPYKDKDEFVMPENHTYQLRSMLHDIEEILIIGWKGTEAAFQEILKNSLGDKKIKISVVTEKSEDIRETYKTIFPKMEDQDWTFHKGGFSKYIAKGNDFFSL
jgi:RNA-binding protein YhbY